MFVFGQIIAPIILIWPNGNFPLFVTAIICRIGLLHVFDIHILCAVRWIASQAKKDHGDDALAKYDG